MDGNELLGTDGMKYGSFKGRVPLNNQWKGEKTSENMLRRGHPANPPSFKKGKWIERERKKERKIEK